MFCKDYILSMIQMFCFERQPYVMYSLIELLAHPLSPPFQITAMEYLLVVDHWSNKLKTYFGAMLIDGLF